MKENKLLNDAKENMKLLQVQVSLEDEKSETIARKNSALQRLDVSFNKHIEMKEYKKSNVLAYWIKDFSNYHDEERTFDTHKLKRYKRGDIIKVNLGFNVGNELGGLHYCVVINKSDNLSYGTINVVPLSSIKPSKKNNSYDLNLGDELYSSLYKKFHKQYQIIKEKLQEILATNSHDENSIEISKSLSIELNYLQKLLFEIRKMKEGSIARITQITTISKQRIYNPKSKNDILSGIKLSNESMDLIDQKIIELYTK